MGSALALILVLVSALIVFSLVFCVFVCKGQPDSFFPLEKHIEPSRENAAKGCSFGVGCSLFESIEKGAANDMPYERHGFNKVVESSQTSTKAIVRNLRKHGGPKKPSP